MLGSIIKLLGALKREQKKQLFFLQLLVIVSAIMEVVTILVFGPFMTFVSSNVLNDNPFFKKLYFFLGVDSHKEFLLALSLFILLSICISTLFSIVTIRKLSLFAAEVGAEFGDRLYSLYMNKDFLYHSSVNSAEIMKKISTEVNRVTDNILQPTMQINARIATVVFVLVFVFVYNPTVAIIGVFTISLTYYILFGVVKNRLLQNGKMISVTSKKRFKLLNEGLNAIKEIQILGRENFFVDKFEESGEMFSKAYGSSNSLYNIPRYIVEFILFSGIIMMAIVFILGDENKFTTFLPTLAVLGIASLKLLPSFQQIYSGMAQIRSHTSAFDSIQEDLKEALIKKSYLLEKSTEKISGDIYVKEAIFTYPNQPKPAITGISLHIPLRARVGVVGPSGSGKSTLIDLLMGSIIPQEGELSVGGTVIDHTSVSKWRNNIGYVSQMPLIIDGSIAENVALGINRWDIDITKLDNSLKIAHLYDWVKELPNSYETIVGERGMKISGGQRQRIAIARAFYNNPEYLFFDEATSSLDTITETNIMETLEEISGNKTIVMIAHRLNTVKKCDWIYIISDGRVKDEGTFEYLIQNNNDFSIMAGNDAKK